MYISGGLLKYKVPDGSWYYFYYSSGSITRTLGTVYKSNVSQESGYMRTLHGFCSVNNGGPNANVRIDFNPGVGITSSGVRIQDNGDLSSGYNYKFALVLRAAGVFSFLIPKGGSQWLLAAISPIDTTSTFYPGVQCSYGGSTNDLSSSDYLHVFNTGWYPTPIAGDAFSGTWPTTDGKGHRGLPIVAKECMAMA